jgi:hypothetical protein
MVGISGAKEQELAEEEIRARTDDLLTSVEPLAPGDRSVDQPQWVLIKPDRRTALGELHASTTPSPRSTWIIVSYGIRRER